MALSSAHDVDNHLELAGAIELLDPQLARALQEKVWELKRMLTALHRTVRRKGELLNAPYKPDHVHPDDGLPDKPG